MPKKHYITHKRKSYIRNIKGKLVKRTPSKHTKTVSRKIKVRKNKLSGGALPFSELSVYSLTSSAGALLHNIIPSDHTSVPGNLPTNLSGNVSVEQMARVDTPVTVDASSPNPIPYTSGGGNKQTKKTKRGNKRQNNK